MSDAYLSPFTGNQVDEAVRRVHSGETGAGSTELLNKLSAWYDDEHYTPMTGILVMTPSTTTYEIGTSPRVTFNWTFDKTPSEVTFGGISQDPVSSGTVTKTISSLSDSSFSYTLFGKYVDQKTGKIDTVSRSVAINFRNKYYYGCAAKPTVINGNFIKTLSTSGWATIKTASFTANCEKDEYIWYAYPARLGKVTTFMNNWEGGFDEPTVVQVTNGSGFTEDYYVYRSTNSGIGSQNILAE